MKKSIVLALAILVIGAILPVFQSRQLAGLQDRHQKLTAEAAALDVSDPSSPRTLARQKRENQVRAMEVKWADFADRMSLYEKKPYLTEGGYQERFGELLDGLGSMDDSRLRWLVAKVREDTKISHHTRSMFLIESIRKISAAQPAMALELYVRCADLIEQGDQTPTLTQALCNLAVSDAFAVAEWLRKNGEKYASHADEHSKSEVIGSVAISDPALAFEIMESQQFPQIFWLPLRVIIGTVENYPERRDPVLAALRHHLAGLSSDAEREKSRIAAIELFAASLGNDPFDSASDWISKSNFSAVEKALFAGSLPYEGTQENTGRWIEWMAANLPGESLAEPVKRLVGQWTRQNYQAAGAWLKDTPESLAKNVAVLTYATAVAAHEPQVAGQWAMTLPLGPVREEALRAVHQKWPNSDPAGAAAFAREHGMK